MPWQPVFESGLSSGLMWAVMGMTNNLPARFSAHHLLLIEVLGNDLSVFHALGTLYKRYHMVDNKEVLNIFILQSCCESSSQSRSGSDAGSQQRW